MNAADLLINATLYYGPGLVLAVVAVTGWRGIRWSIKRHYDRAERRHYTAVAFRLNRVADRADALLAMPADLVNARLEAQYAASGHVQDEGR